MTIERGFPTNFFRPWALALTAGLALSLATGAARAEKLPLDILGPSGAPRHPVTAGATPAPIDQATIQIQRPLSSLAARTGPLMLRDAQAGADFFIPVSARIEPRRALLQLHFTNSMALDPKRSVLAVRLNEATLGQIALDPNNAATEASIELPPALLRPGFNKLTIAVSQHYDSLCEDPEAPELWTEIDTTHSVLTVDATLARRSFRLSQLDGLFSPGLGGIRQVSLLTGGPLTSPLLLKAASLTAQGVALRTKYEPVKFILPPEPGNGAMAEDAAAPPADQVLIGTARQLAPWLSAAAAARISGPYLGIDSLGGPRPAQRLIVAGRTEEEVLQAARALAIMDFPLADAPDMVVHDLVRPKPGTPLGASRYLAADTSYRFADIGQPTATLRGQGPNGLRINLPMPPDLYTDESAVAKLGLDLAYGPGMAPGSSVNVLINGSFVRGIPLDKPDGDSFTNYQISIPMRRFVAGQNALSVDTFTRPRTMTGACAGKGGRNLILSVLGSSRLTFPDAGHVAAQPDLKLFATTAFPYFRTDGTAAPTIQVTRPALLPAALAVAGKLAQVAKAPLEDLTLQVGPAAKATGNLILLAPRDDLPKGLFDGVSYGIGKFSKIPYDLLHDRPPQSGEDTGLLPWLMSFFGVEAYAAPAPPNSGYLIEGHGLGETAVVTAVQSEDGAAATVTIMTAESPVLLLGAVDRLVTPAFWSQLGGSFAIWRDTKDSVHSLSVGPTYQIGRASPALRLRFYLSREPWLWLGLSVFSLLGLAFVTLRILRRRQRAMHIPEQ